MSRTTREVFEDHLAKRSAGDVEGDIIANYDKNVVFLTGTGCFFGHDGVRESAKELEKYLGGSEFSYNNKLTYGEYAFLEWSGQNKDRKVCDGADSFVIRNGKIVMQSIHYTVTES